MTKGGRYLVGFGGPGGPVSLGSTDNENIAIARARTIACAISPAGFGTVIDRYKGTAWQWKCDKTGRIDRQGMKLPDGVTGALLGANLGADADIVASMRRKGGGASVMGIPLSMIIAPRYIVCLHSGSSYIPICSSRNSLPAIATARKVAQGAAGSKLYTIVCDRRSRQSWTFVPDSKGHVRASGPGLSGASAMAGDSAKPSNTAAKKSDSVPVAKLEAFLRSQKNANTFGIVNYGPMGQVFEVRWEPMTPVPALPYETVSSGRSYPIVIWPAYRDIAYRGRDALEEPKFDTDIKTER